LTAIIDRFSLELLNLVERHYVKQVISET
jgi:hypothetical protein